MLKVYFLVVIFICNSCISPFDINTRIVNEILTKKLYTNKLNKTIVEVTQGLTKKSRFENKWQINKPLKIGYLNVYVLKDNIKFEEFELYEMHDLFGNCAFLGSNNIIVCDSKFLNSFVKTKRIYDNWPNEENYIATANASFISWVIGHEIAHVLLKHEASHFQANNFTKEIPSRSISYINEQQADSLFVGKLKKDTAILLNLTSFLIELLNKEIFNKIGTVPAGAGILYDYNNQKVVEYFTLGTHPEYVIRTTRMLETTALFLNDKGLSTIVNKFSNHMRERKPTSHTTP